MNHMCCLKATQERLTTAVHVCYAARARHYTCHLCQRSRIAPPQYISSKLIKPLLPSCGHLFEQAGQNGQLSCQSLHLKQLQSGLHLSVISSH